LEEANYSSKNGRQRTSPKEKSTFGDWDLLGYYTKYLLGYKNFNECANSATFFFSPGNIFFYRNHHRKASLLVIKE
jgi:hypothetical protein